MRQLLLSTEKKAIFLLLILCGTVTVSAATVVVEYPRYNKSFADGTMVYEIALDDQSRIVGMTTDGGAETLVDYDDAGNARLFAGGQLRTTFSRATAFDEACQLKTDPTGAFLLESAPMGNATMPTRCEFSNSILMRGNGQSRYEYCADGDGYGIKFSELLFKDGKTGLFYYNPYPWEERIVITGSPRSGDSETDRLNFIILREYDWDLACILSPLLFCETPAEFSFLEFGATSYLTEGTVQYAPQNLAAPGGLPWASANGAGIGDHLTIRTDIQSDMYLGLHNGYQNAQKPYLYGQNSRAKRIRISCPQTGKACDYDLQDTADEQVLDIRRPLLDTWGGTVTLDVEILAVYEGTDYADLCIDALVPFLWNAPTSTLPQTIVHPAAVEQPKAPAATPLAEAPAEQEDTQPLAAVPHQPESTGAAVSSGKSRGIRIAISAVAIALAAVTVLVLVLILKKRRASHT